MEIFKLEKDARLICIKAALFPDGIIAAQQNLERLFPGGSRRRHFGISYLYDDAILYMSANEMIHEDEAVPAGCTTYLLKKGTYSSIYLTDFKTDIMQVDRAFKRLLDNPGIDPEGCCAECYLPESTNFSAAKDMRCMVRLAD